MPGDRCRDMALESSKTSPDCATLAPSRHATTAPTRRGANAANRECSTVVSRKLVELVIVTSIVTR